ncbi:hypothetical protein HYZ41_03410 [archaeon]|nr:hypothetical protein [archaeon]
MPMEYVKDMKIALKNYSELVLPAINEKNYGAAFCELGNVNQLLTEGFGKVSKSTMLYPYTLGLLARLEVLEGYLFNISMGNKQTSENEINNAKIGVEDKLPTVQLMVDALYDKHFPEKID